MVTPHELLTLAEMIAAIPGEAAARKAVSCAYYAAYLHCTGLVEGRWRPGDHRRVFRAMRQREPAIGSNLGALRSQRIAADYDIRASFTIAPEQAIEVAREILSYPGDSGLPDA